jgi:hypothetical protein
MVLTISIIEKNLIFSILNRKPSVFYTIEDIISYKDKLCQ